MTCFNPDKMFTFVRGYAMASKWDNTIEALNFARVNHADQKRKGGEPYIIHPLTMACHAIAVGLTEDNIIATCLLHDVMEDCGVKEDDLPVSYPVKEAVRLLTFIKGENSLDSYYKNISERRVVSLVKLLDRCDNVSTMAGVFNTEKLDSYCHETDMYVVPLIKSTKEKWPGYSNAIFVLKYHILSIVSSIESILDEIKANEAGIFR